MLHIFISSSGGEIRPGSTGRVVPGYEARVVDEDGNEVPPGTIGHLAVRGPTGCRYLDNLERQRVYVRNGWNLPGDSYVQDADGYFWYQARTDDLIVSAGHKISGPEVESVLLDHPAVAECGVVAAPDEGRGYIVKAYVVTRPGFTPGQELIKELQDFVKSEIAPYKYPRAIEFLDSPAAHRDRQAPALPAAGARRLSDILLPEGWAKPIGYANGIAARGRLVFVAGQIGWNPATCQFETDDFAAQTEQTLRNVAAVLREAGAGPEHIARMTWYITDKPAYLAARRDIGRAWREILGRIYPTMAVVVVSALIEDRAKVEIEATAVVPE